MFLKIASDAGYDAVLPVVDCNCPVCSEPISRTPFFWMTPMTVDDLFVHEFCFRQLNRRYVFELIVSSMDPDEDWKN